MTLMVNYSMAHSDPRGSPGASNMNGVNERMVAHTAYEPLKLRLEAEGFDVDCFSGPLNPVVRLIRKKAIKKARKAGRPWVSVELHFNHPPLVECPNPDCTVPKIVTVDGEREVGRMRRKIFAGIPCPACGAEPVRSWRFGPTVMVNRWSEASRDLGEEIINQLLKVMPWAKKRKPILMPDSRYGRKLWPETVDPPAALVEAGFGCDPNFSKWLDDPASQAAYGMMVAEAICEWYERRKNTPLESWGK